MADFFTAAVVAGAILFMAVSSASAATVTSLGSNQYEVEFDPISFEITADGNLGSIIFEDFFSSSIPGSGTFVSGTVQASLNGSATQDLAGNDFAGHFNAFGEVDGDDLFVTFNQSFLSTFGAVSVGDTVVISTMNYVFESDQVIPAANSGPFRAFLVNTLVQRISEDGTAAVVPLPAALPLLLSALGVFGFFGWRRRQTATA